MDKDCSKRLKIAAFGIDVSASVRITSIVVGKSNEAVIVCLNNCQQKIKIVADNRDERSWKHRNQMAAISRHDSVFKLLKNNSVEVTKSNATQQTNKQTLVQLRWMQFRKNGNMQHEKIIIHFFL